MSHFDAHHSTEVDKCANLIRKADSLKSSTTQRKSLSTYIRDIAKQIDRELNAAKNRGEYEIQTDIPTTYHVQNMSNSCAQRIIISTILKILNMRGYRSQIILNKKECVIKITWMTKEDTAEIRQQLDFIAKHSVKEFTK